MLFLVAKAQINALCLHGVLLFKFHPARKPHRGRCGGDTIEQISLGGCPQRKQPGQRVAAQNDFDVLREMKLLLQRGNDLFRQKAQGVRSLTSKALLSPHSRGFPRGKCIVPVFHRNGCKQKVVRTLCNSGNLAFHALQLVFAGHLEQQVFRMGFAVNAARSAPDLHCLCGHCDVLPKKL